MLLNFKVFTQSLNDIDLKSVRVINTINPHSYCISKKDEDFENALKSSDILLPDGIGIVWAEKVLNKNKIQKIAGYDLFVFLMQHLNTTKGTCFFLGASEATLSAIENNASKDYPNVQIHSYSPPYKEKFSDVDSGVMCKMVNQVQPDVLFVGMTAPKQEKWVFQYNDQLQADIICSIGAVFDFYAGTVKRPSVFWIKLGLEWLPRLIKEPKRLAKRNFISTPKFIIEVIYFKIFRRGVL